MRIKNTVPSDYCFASLDKASWCQSVTLGTDFFIRTSHPCKIIRIFHGCEVRIEKPIRGSLFVITRLCRLMPNSVPGGRIFLSAPNSHDRFFFLHTFLSSAFYFNVRVAINESRIYTLTFTILKVDVVCDVAMTSTPNALTTALRDRLYNQNIYNTSCYSFLSIARVG